MLQVRPADARGHANHGWLDSYHTFSFADYYDPSNMGFRDLRVINEDRIAGGRGFPTHGHNDMEIITYVIEGALAHKDTLGTSSLILPGEVQTMTAGSGIQHSEFNHLQDQSTHLLQIWILPDQSGLKPAYGQKSFAEQLQSVTNKNLVLVASKGAREGSVGIHQDVDLYVGKWATSTRVDFTLRSPYGWVQMVRGSLVASGQTLSAGDGLAIANEKSLTFESKGAAEFLLFDLP